VGCQKLSSECKMMLATGMSLHRKSQEGVSSAENLPVHIREVSVSNPGLVLFEMLCCLRWRILLQCITVGNVFLQHAYVRFPAVPPLECKIYRFTIILFDWSLYSYPTAVSPDDFQYTYAVIKTATTTSSSKIPS